MSVGQLATDTDTATATASGTATTTASGMVVEVAGDVEPEVVAALVAAVDACWPRPPSGVVTEEDRIPAWRFSGRWWSRPATHRRVRPRA